jgi:hypothetical protein
MDWGSEETTERNGCKGLEKDDNWKGINGRKLWSRSRPKLGCRAKEKESLFLMPTFPASMAPSLIQTCDKVTNDWVDSIRVFLLYLNNSLLSNCYHPQQMKQHWQVT